MRHFILLIALLGFAAGASAAGRHVRFLGPHPIAAKYGGGYCYIEAPHLHIYPPDHPALYQQVGEQYVFTGDPTPFGYDGDRFQFYGHHPVPGQDGVYCFIDGPHYHPYRQPEGPEYKVESDVAFYVAPLPEPYLRLKPQRERLVNEEYRPYAHLRPRVEVTPPPEWHGTAYVAVPAPPGAPGVVVGAPGVEVRGPNAVVAAPGVEVRGPGVEVRGPGVEVRGPGVEVRGPGVYVEPPRPVGVVVAPPPPPGVILAPRGGVVVGAPPVRGGIYVEGEVEGEGHGHHGHGEHGEREEHEHHDNGVRRHGGKR